MHNYTLLILIFMPNRAAEDLHVQHNRYFYKISMVLQHMSIDSVWLLQNCLLFQLMKRKSVL